MVAYPFRWLKSNWSVVASDGRTINFLSIIPLYSEELEFKLTNGPDAFIDLFTGRGISELLDPNRVCLVPKA
jgi:hypothetical protein